MRISDWSSDVCSSDLPLPTYDDSLPKDSDKNLYLWIQDGWQTELKSVIAEARSQSADNPTLFIYLPAAHRTELSNTIVALEAAGKPLQRKRSEERRVGNECVSTCRSGWSQ